MLHRSAMHQRWARYSSEDLNNKRVLQLEYLFYFAVLFSYLNIILYLSYLMSLLLYSVSLT